MALMRRLKKTLIRCFSKKPSRKQHPPLFRSGWAERSAGATYFYSLRPKLRLQVQAMPIIKENDDKGVNNEKWGGGNEEGGEGEKEEGEEEKEKEGNEWEEKEKVVVFREPV